MGIVDRVFPDCHIQSDYDPMKGTTDDMGIWGSETATILNTLWLLQKVQSIIDDRWLINVMGMEVEVPSKCTNAVVGSGLHNEPKLRASNKSS